VFSDFSKNAPHFSKNIVTLTLNFENFSDLFFLERVKLSQIGPVKVQHRCTMPEIVRKCFKMNVFQPNQPLGQLRSVKVGQASCARCVVVVGGGASGELGVKSAELRIMRSQFGWSGQKEPRCSADFRSIPLNSANFRVTGEGVLPWNRRFDCLGPTPAGHRGGIGRDARCDRPGGLFHPQTNFRLNARTFRPIWGHFDPFRPKKEKVGTESEFH
jgi:hypothetical protein